MAIKAETNITSVENGRRVSTEAFRECFKSYSEVP